MKRINEHIMAAALIAIGIIVLGLCIKSAINDFTNKDRKVVVKGLAEKLVDADKVTWPIQAKETGNDLPMLYQKIAQTQSQIKQFLLRSGVSDKEIDINAPTVVDLNADQYSNNERGYRYIITSNITVTSTNVKLIRNIIARQGELLKEGIAIVDGGYQNQIVYEYTAFPAMKPKMMEEAIANAEKTAEQFASNSKSQINKIISADQGQFSIENRDENTPYVKKVRVVTTITYSLKD